jgi:hypothetical protein
MYKKQKKVSTENIKDYNKHKQLCLLTKSKSPQTISIVEDINDPWFLYVISYKTKSGIVTDTSMIIESDCETRIRHLTNLGWIVKNNK